MNVEELARCACMFSEEFKQQIVRQISDLHALGDGRLQDGFKVTFIDDGWIGLKGYSWGFVIHYDNPITMNMTFGPDAPFVGYNITFVARPMDGRLVWVDQNSPNLMTFSTEQLVHFGLKKLTVKTGDSWLFEKDKERPEIGYGGIEREP